MRALIVVVVILVVLGFVGWIKFSSPNGDPTLRVDTNKVKEDTSAIVEKSKELTHRAVGEVDEASDNIDATFNREQTTPRTP